MAALCHTDGGVATLIIRLTLGMALSVIALRDH
jgi:hypothetical protein